MSKHVVRDKSFAFAVRVVKLCRFLNTEHKEFVLSKQVLRSGTAIGALVREAEHAESRADFVHKMHIALKEANETLYWLALLHQSAYLTTDQYASLQPDAEELVKLLVSIVKTSKQSLQKRVDSGKGVESGKGKVESKELHP
jgi:four helix bundle protein